MDRTNEYLREIRAIDGLKNAVLEGICVYKRQKIAEFSLITDRSFTKFDENDALEITQKYLPAEFSAKVKITKRLVDEELLQECIFSFVTDTFPAA